MSQTLPPPAIWIEIDDLIAHFSYSDQPTGIQRVLLELLAAADHRALPHVRLCRLHARSGEFETLDVPLLRAIIARAKREARVTHRLGRVHRQLGFLARDMLRLGRQSRLDRAGRADRAEAFAHAILPGDVVVSMGASWENKRYGAVLAEQKARFGFRFAQLVHDIIPIRHGAISNPDFVQAFTSWLHATSQSVDLYLMPSRHVAIELAHYAAAQGWPARPTAPIRFGTGFASTDAPAAPLPPVSSEPFVLCVTTVDLRKNVGLLISVWERLVATYGAARVPLLLLAGHRGYRSGELFARLRASNFVGGRIRFVERPRDDALKALYRETLFTVFPSHAEGWGLPVEEGLSYGKFGICSSATSIPEVGGDLVDYFDPFDENGAYAAIEKAILDPAYVAARAARIRDTFRPVSWTATFDALVTTLEHQFALGLPQGHARPVSKAG